MRDGRYMLNHNEVNAIREIYRLYRNEYSYREINVYMNESGYPPYNADGWNKHHIKTVRIVAQKLKMLM